jgi:hypothetical protein
MNSFWSAIATSKNRQILSWIGGAIVAVTAGGWAVVTYIWPAHEGAQAVCAQQGSLAAGRDASGNTIIYNGSAPAGVGNGAIPCVETARK